ncbi:hypothetical protein TNCV_241611 [Trichonephila clavipes]|uniref:Uncharacterized protein n=1 Tax=Trichonephila clavipes TaxID=2585209 RepID=A0A8X7BDR0_TRICX|nr:hypothetical protein TNCV_241611 [Trichonephila clavipes]
MALSDSLPQINLGVQGRTRGEGLTTWQQVEPDTRDLAAGPRYTEEDLATTGETRPNQERKDGGSEETGKREKVDIRFERKSLTRKYNPAVYFQADDHVDSGNSPAAVSSEQTRSSSYGVLLLPAELG